MFVGLGVKQAESQQRGEQRRPLRGFPGAARRRSVHVAVPGEQVVENTQRGLQIAVHDVCKRRRRGRDLNGPRLRSSCSSVHGTPDVRFTCSSNRKLVMELEGRAPNRTRRFGCSHEVLSQVYP